ncbi:MULTISPECIES: VOC family protein [Nocardioides]|uniref:VOC family protein n=1 Tax=Nocardioides TaxID=1839 RepID=UPI00033131B4|nr:MULTISPECIES: VOC family protein [Nocardioides]EON23148.1 glyoxalase/bleomycin resistance [Nocardioides sp. CF8]
MNASDQYASVRYLVDDVDAAVEFYTTHLGFELLSHPAPPFADVVRGPLRLLLSGTASSGARATPDGSMSAGRNRIHLVVDDFDALVARLREAGLPFASDVVSGPGGRQVLLTDPAGNLVELFEPAT